MEKKYLVFDAYGTLLQVSADIPGLTTEQKEISQQVQALWRSKQLEYSWLRSLMDKFKGFNQVTYEALTYAFSYHQLEDEVLKQAILAIYEKPTAFPDAWRFLERCKDQGYQTAILSNGEQEMLEKSVVIAGIDPLVDHILSASRVKIFKPSPRVYELATHSFSCEYSDILFFSSNPWDIAGATHFGFQTVWVNRSGLPFEELGVKPHRTIGSFDELRL